MAGNVVSNVKKYYGGQVPVPGQGDSDGKVKVLVEKTATIEIEGVQTEVELLFDSDDLTTPVTPQQLGQWTDENYLIAFKYRNDEGVVRGFILYALETDSTSTDTLVNRATFANFKKDMNDPGASAYVFEMVEDSSTLTRYLRDTDGELIVKFNQSCVEAGAQSGTLDELIQTDTTVLDFEVVHEDGKSYLRLNTEGIREVIDDIQTDLEYIMGALDELPSDEHGYFNSSLYTTPGDGTTTNLVMDNFRIAENRDVHGDSIEFVPTHQEGGVDFGEVYLEPGTYILAIQYTLQWVGNPRGTFLPKVCSVADQPFDFSYEHEDVIQVTRIVTRTTRGKLVTNIPIDADTPPMGVWVKNMEVAQVATFNHSAVAHDTTLTGTGKVDSPLGVTPAAFGKIKDIPTSINQFRTGDVIPVDGPNGTAKMSKDDLLKEASQNALAGNLAPSFDPMRTEETKYLAGESVVYEGETYTFKVDHYGAWNDADVLRSMTCDEIALSKELILGNSITKTFSSNANDKVTEIRILKGMYFECSANAETTGNVEVFAYKDDNTYDNLGFLAFNTAKRFLARNNYIKISLYSTAAYSTETTVSLVGTQQQIEETKTSVSALELDSNGKVVAKDFPSTAGSNLDVAVSIPSGKKFIASIATSESVSGVKFEVYAFYDNSHYDTFPNILINASREYTATHNYVMVRFRNTSITYATTASVEVIGNKQQINDLKTGLESNISNLSDLNTFVKGAYAEKEFASSVTVREVSISVKEGDTFELFITTSSANNGESFEIYAYKADGTYDTFYPVIINIPSMYRATHNYNKIRFYKSNVGYNTKASVLVYGIEQRVSGSPLNILVLGDSYTASESYWRAEFMRLMPVGTVLRTTAVGSASVKDHYADRITYPYTSRPNSSVNSGNLNTFGCQVEKLKRLMAGTDLDSGETQWYSDGTSPDVVIIEGGQNDSPDNNMNDYASQYEVIMNNVYFKNKETDQIQQGSCLAKPPLDNINRLLFAGAYRYVCESIKEVFPNAQFFITTTSNLHYWTGNGSHMLSAIMQKGEQQRWCARACGAEIIDWQASQITCLTSCPGGSGTSNDPYILSNNGQAYSDSNDGLHPNTKGGRKLGAFMANEILRKFSKHALY